MIPVEYILLIGSLLIIVSIGIARLSENFGVPSLLLFLGIGMLAGSEGPGRIYFDDAHISQSVGVIALVFILFAGGLDTKWAEVKPVFRQATTLATLGVFLTAMAVGLFSHFVLGFSLLTGLLLGAVVSSTDAAAVFSVLRSKNVSLSGRAKPLLELESGSNDPMAVLLTVGIIQIITNPETSISSVALIFVVQMGLGIVFGLGFGKIMVFMLNRLKSHYEGVYPVFSLAFAALAYGATAAAGGSGFLAVYLMGLLAGNSEFVHKKSMMRFFDGLAWLSQITMFLTLGLLVFPSHIIPILWAGLICSAFLMFVARPLSVFLSLLFERIGWREKILVSWVGLRGSVPIVLATFPLLAGVADAEAIFNIIFFIVITSALLQGWSIPVVARLLRLDAPIKQIRKYPIEYAPMPGVDTQLLEFIIPYSSAIAGKQIVELGLPRDSLIVLVNRDENFFVPSGSTTLEGGDVVLVMLNQNNLAVVREILMQWKKPKEEGKEKASATD
ncbi:MAG TPA: potassium/proton antiporter [Syntrophorhabdus sp.]|nr:potassium/proton antiporter [Syntrophorhabdus sp.]